ncbi:MAG TPA: hypothetical protein DCY88_10435 [Cyanobacteria bacterium UBA11372]|nr:hypothetical protein [Cyanobacteria bacterium UBA11372]
MDDWENFAKKAFNLFVGGVSLAVEETQKMLQEMGEQVQILADEAIKEGEAKYNEWCSQQQHYENQPREELRQKLWILLHGDTDLAERLVDLARQKHPNRSEDWYWEKVIYDLERDRDRSR